MNDRSSARPRAAFAVRPTPPKKPVRPSSGSMRAARRPVPAPAAVEPTILLVGADTTFEPALRAALARHRVYVETTTAETVAETVIAAAPDLVLLVGPAARDGGSRVLETLMSSPVSSVIPVAILDDNTALDMRLRAFRHGAAAVIAPSASIDAIAEQVAKLAREIPERGSESLGLVGEATLSEFVGALSRELRSGILSVHTGQGDDDAVRLVLGSGRPLAAFIDDFVRRVKSHVVHAEPLKYEFAEHASGTVTLLDPAAPPEAERVSVKGVRVALVDDDTGRADSVAQELRSRGVTVVVTDLTPTDLRFAKLRQVDPEVLLIGESHVKGRGYELLRRMRRDARLRWASLLVVRWDEIWSDALSVPALDRLETALAALSEADRTLQGWSETGESFDARLEITGPARCLRALTASPRPLRVTVNNPRVSVSVDISDGLIVGAAGESRLDPNQKWDGALALSALMVLSSGRVHVAPVSQPAVTNVMATVDVALNMADSEPAPITPSIPVATPTSLPSAPSEQPVSASLPPKTSTSMQPAGASTRPGSSFLAQTRAGVSVPAASFFVALAALQGLLVVAALSLLLKPRGSKPAGNASPATSAQHQAARAAPVKPPDTGSAQAKTQASTAHDLPSAAPHANLPPDESGRSAPSCEESLGSVNVKSGDYPGAAYGQVREANRALVRGDIDAAQTALCKAVLWNQKNPALPLELAQLMLLRRDGAKAVAWAEKGLALDAASARGQSILGDGLARVGDYDGAKRAWLASMHLEPSSDPQQLKALSFSSVREAQASMKRRDPARAERFFRRGAVLDPDNVAASNGLAEALLKLGDPSSALRWANHSIAVAPRDPAARIVLGDVLFQRGDRGAAEVEWREALQLDPANYGAQLRVNRLAPAR